jgi:hypothetical protein
VPKPPGADGRSLGFVEHCLSFLTSTPVPALGLPAASAVTNQIHENTNTNDPVHDNGLRPCPGLRLVRSTLPIKLSWLLISPCIRPTGTGISPGVTFSSVPSQQVSGVSEPPATTNRPPESFTVPSSSSRGTKYVSDRPYAHRRC